MAPQDIFSRSANASDNSIVLPSIGVETWYLPKSFVVERKGASFLYLIFIALKGQLIMTTY